MSEEPDTIDVWTIIDTYFRDTTYYKSQHQLDLITNLYTQIQMVFNILLNEIIHCVFIKNL